MATALSQSSENSRSNITSQNLLTLSLEQRAGQRAKLKPFELGRGYAGSILCRRGGGWLRARNTIKQQAFIEKATPRGHNGKGRRETIFHIAQHILRKTSVFSVRKVQHNYCRWSHLTKWAR